jgi:hypothetical protein
MARQIEIALTIKVNVPNCDKCTEENIMQELVDKLRVGVQYDEENVFNVVGLKINDYMLI